MSSNPLSSRVLPPAYLVDVNVTDPIQLARRLHAATPDQRPRLLIDCQQLRCLRTRGVSYLVSQLLLTRAVGADVLLYNVAPTLERMFHLLRLHRLFTIWPVQAGMVGNRGSN
jgi:anti-anti-sigma factor